MHDLRHTFAVQTLLGWYRNGADVERNLPILEGRITGVSADSFVDEKSGASFFTVDVVVPPAEAAKIARVRGADAGLRPGLPVEVVVPLRKRTALQYFFEPLQQSVWRSFREQ